MINPMPLLPRADDGPYVLDVRRGLLYLPDQVIPCVHDGAAWVADPSRPTRVTSVPVIPVVAIVERSA
jgi:hypothetical protein